MQEDISDSLYEPDFDGLIDALITFGGQLVGQAYTYGTKNFYLGEGLGRKILQHAISFKQLSESYQLKLMGKAYERQIDFASGCILARAALETYLTFNHIFIAAATTAQHEFRFQAWDYAGYHERLKNYPADPQFQRKYNKEMTEKEALRLILENDSHYKVLSEGLKRNLIRKGEWRLEKSWSDLAVAAGFEKIFFEQQYRYLCGFAHSSRISVIQIQQITDLDQQKQMLYGPMAILMVVLAKHSYDYIQTIPELRMAVDISSTAYQLVLKWKQVGEGITGNIIAPPI